MREKIAQLLETVQLLKQLQERLPSFYLDETTLKPDYEKLMKITLSSASHSQNTSRATTPRTSGSYDPLFTSKLTTQDITEPQKNIRINAFLTIR